MAKELSGLQSPIDEQIINTIITNLDNINSPHKDLVKQFWLDNKSLLIGMSAKTATEIIKKSHNHEALRTHYTNTIAEMTWEERNILLSKGLEDLKKLNSKKVNELIFINNLIVIGIKAIPLILAVL